MPNILQSTLEFVKKHEGVYNKAYKDPIGLWTIGVGHLIKKEEEYLKTKTLSNLEVDLLLESDLKIAKAYIDKYVKVTINQNQFDAIISFIFNLGGGNFIKSTLLKKINEKSKCEDIKKEFEKWTKAGGKVLPGLVKRRKEESELFCKS